MFMPGCYIHSHICTHHHRHMHQHIQHASKQAESEGRREGVGEGGRKGREEGNDSFSWLEKVTVPCMLVLAQPSVKISPNLQASRSQKLIENGIFLTRVWELMCYQNSHDSVSDSSLKLNQTLDSPGKHSLSVLPTFIFGNEWFIL